MYHVQYRRAALAVYEFFGSMRKAAAALHVSIASICRWCKRVEPVLRRRCTKAGAAIEEYVRSRLLHQPCTTCRDLVADIDRVFSVSVSRQLVQIVVRRLGFTRKRTRKRGISPRSVSERGPFRQALQVAIGQGPVVAIDESGFDQRNRPLYGYAPCGQPAVLKLPAFSDHRRLNLLMAIDDEGNSHHNLYTESVKGSTFADFLMALPHPPGTTIILDNASIHRTKQVMAVAERKRFRLLFLPPYTPEFNPIELVFGVCKNDFYKARYTDFNTGLSDVVRCTVTRCARSDTVKNCFRHVYSLIAKEAGDADPGCTAPAPRA